MADSRNCSWISLRKTPMFKKYKNLSDSRLKVVEQLDGSVIPLSNKAKLSLYKKSLNSGIGADILEEVYVRGYSTWNESFHGTPEQFAFDRVNSFISGGFAQQLDQDLIENIDAEKITKNKDKPSSRFVGTKELTNVYVNDTPGQTIKVIKKLVNEIYHREEK